MSNALIILTLALSNWFIRGGGYEQLFPKTKYFPAKIIHPLLFGICAYLTMPDWRYGVLMAIAHRIGQAPAIFDSAADSHVNYVLKLSTYRQNVSKKSIFIDIWPHVVKWAYVVWLRGLVWFAPIVGVSLFFVGLHALYFGLVALAMPLCYAGVFKPFNKGWLNQWTVGEFLFGACIGLALVYI